MKRLIAVAATAAMVLGLLAVPASANKVDSKTGTPVVKDLGVVDAVAKVGKARDGCDNAGNSTVTGAGIGIPVLNGQKNAYYEIGNTGATPGTATSLANGHVGIIKVCGKLTKMFSAAGGGLGAACGSSKGYDGQGSIFFPAKGTTVWLNDLGWKASVTTFVVTARAVQAGSAAAAKAKKASSNDTLVAVIQAFGADACLTKSPLLSSQSKTGGATTFTVRGVYALVQGAAPNANDYPGTCKDGATSGCLNDPKKH